MNTYKSLKAACYTANLSMSVVINFSPLLFITFKELYGISYSLLGLLILINFSAQLLVDLIFSFFSHKFNISVLAKITPFLAFFGLIIFSLSPFVFKNTYLGLVLGTIIFSSSSGFAEVLLSPIIAAIPSDNPDREMSKLHSVYAWGAVPVVIITTIYITTVGREFWYILSFIYAFIPLSSFLLFLRSEIPNIEATEKTAGILPLMKKKELWFFFLAIFLSGATECTMAQWASSYLEKALTIPKFLGDMLGVAGFSIMLGLGRSLYAKRGKNIENLLTLSAFGAVICYLLAIITPFAYLGLIACISTGLFSAMLWPGSLILSSKHIPNGGVFLYAIMATGGDLGAAVVSQAVGIIADATSIRTGLSIAIIFPFILLLLFLRLRNKSKAECYN